MDRNWRVLLIAGVISLCSAQFVFASYSLGDSGDAVKDLQRRLTQAGCLVRADGRFNETTVSAVKKFQKKHNLDVDGVVGPVTYKALTGKTLKSKKHSSARKNKMSPGGIGIDDVSVSWHKPGKLAPRVQAIMEEAKKYVGVPYRFGGMTPSGFDCLSIMYLIKREFCFPAQQMSNSEEEKGCLSIGWNQVILSFFPHTSREYPIRVYIWETDILSVPPAAAELLWQQ